MSEKHNISLRVHTEVIDKPKDAGGKHHPSATKEHPKWAEHALVFDCETRTDTRQELTFGFYRLLQLNGDAYELVEEGAFYDDDLPADERKVLEAYSRIADTDNVVSFPPRFPMLSKTEFVKEVFYKYAHRGALIVGFNLPFDLARCACKWPEGEKKEWSLILKENPDGSEDKIYPRVHIDPIDSKKAFISFANQWIPEDSDIGITNIGNSRFLDLRTLLWALFNKAYSLKRACDNKKGPFKSTLASTSELVTNVKCVGSFHLCFLMRSRIRVASLEALEIKAVLGFAPAALAPSTNLAWKMNGPVV